jgi:hypothetical protein
MQKFKEWQKFEEWLKDQPFLYDKDNRITMCSRNIAKMSFIRIYIGNLFSSRGVNLVGFLQDVINVLSVLLFPITFPIVAFIETLHMKKNAMKDCRDRYDFLCWLGDMKDSE